LSKMTSSHRNKYREQFNVNHTAAEDTAISIDTCVFMNICITMSHSYNYGVKRQQLRSYNHAFISAF
jgi:hypothetical protein